MFWVRDEGSVAGVQERDPEQPLDTFSAISSLSFQSFDICGRVGGVRKALKLLCTSQVSWLQTVPAEVTGNRSKKQILRWF